MRSRLFLGSILVVAAVIGVSGLFAEKELREWLEARIESELEHDLAAAQTAAEHATHAPNQELATSLGRALGVRVTFIDANGIVVGDSDVEDARLAQVENHRERPEVQAAFAGTQGRSRRTSATVHKDMLYLARRFTRPDDVAKPVDADGVNAGAAPTIGVVRVAADYDDVEAAVWRLRSLLALAGALGLAAAVVMSGAASHLLSRTMRELIRYARSLAGANGAQVDVDAGDLGDVAGTLKHLAGDLARSVAELADERNRTAAVLEAMSEGVIALDKDGKVVVINAAARTMLRLEDAATTAQGRRLIEVSRAPALDDVAKRASHGENASVEIELIGPRQRTVLVRAAPAVAGGAVVVLHDITELRRLERVRRDFVSNVSHELRTPVSVIRASAETLLSGVDGPDAQKFLEGIERNATRLTRLVADLLDLSRIEAGQVAFAKDELRVADVCRRAVDNLGMAAAAHKIVIDVDEALLARGDAKAIDQVLVNLLDNALKYTPPGSTIRVRGSLSAREARVRVEDDGPGIEPKHRDRIFERFYRVDPGRSRDVGGTGLGLAIVKHLVEGMGGRVSVEPGVPRGSVFSFTLPRADA